MTSFATDDLLSPNPDHPEKGVNSAEITQVLHDKQAKVICLVMEWAWIKPIR